MGIFTVISCQGPTFFGCYTLLINYLSGTRCYIEPNQIYVHDSMLPLNRAKVIIRNIRLYFRLLTIAVTFAL